MVNRAGMAGVLVPYLQSCLQFLSSTCESNTLTVLEDNRLKFELRRLQAMIFALQGKISWPKPGRGRSVIPRLISVEKPQTLTYDYYVGMEDRFRDQCGFSPIEFNELLDDVQEVMEEVRDVDGLFDYAENQLRKRRRYRLSAKERLFQFLAFLRKYPSLRKAEATVHPTALQKDVEWLRRRLVSHPLLKAEVQWGSPADRPGSDPTCGVSSTPGQSRPTDSPWTGTRPATDPIRIPPAALTRSSGQTQCLL